MTEHEPLVDSPPDTGEGLEIIEKRRPNKATFLSAVFNLTNTIIGGGILALPYAFKTCGLVLGCFLLIMTALFCAMSAHYLMQAAVLANARSYKDLAVTCFGGKIGAIVVDVSMIIFLGGACVGYIVIIGDITTPFLELTNWNYNERVARTIIMGIVSLFVMYPLSMLKRMDSLRYTSMAAIACIGYLVAVISIQWDVQVGEEGIVGEKVTYFNATPSVFAVLPIIGFAFTFHMQIFPIMVEMKHPEQMNWVVRSSIMICLGCYLVVGITGYLTFYGDTRDNILNNYVDQDIPISLGKAALFFILCFSYPVLAYTSRVLIDQMLFKNDDTFRRRAVETTVYLAITYFIAVVVPGISFVFGFIGASAGNFVVFILPTYFFLYLDHKRAVQDGTWERPVKLRHWLWWLTWRRVPPLVILLFGICFTIISNISIIVEL